jgi:thiol-disulfide isomerase/thioredoxin
MTNFQLPHRVHWYQTVWGVGLIGLLVLIGAIAILITILTIKYTLDIRHGQGAEVGQEFYGPFSSLGKNTVITPAVVDRTRLEQGDFPYLGTDHAPITIVEFVDLKCPNCLLAYPIMNQVLQKYGKNIKLVIRQFPLESLHPGTTQVSLFAECARAQGKFLGAYSLAFLYALPVARL